LGEIRNHHAKGKPCLKPSQKLFDSPSLFTVVFFLTLDDMRLKLHKKQESSLFMQEGDIELVDQILDLVLHA